MFNKILIIIWRIINFTCLVSVLNYYAINLTYPWSLNPRLLLVHYKARVFQFQPIYGFYQRPRNLCSNLLERIILRSQLMASPWGHLNTHLPPLMNPSGRRVKPKFFSVLGSKGVMVLGFDFGPTQKPTC